MNVQIARLKNYIIRCRAGRVQMSEHSIAALDLSEVEAMLPSRASTDPPGCWLCGCGCWNGFNLACCRRCNRTTTEGEVRQSEGRSYGPGEALILHRAVIASVIEMPGEIPACLCEHANECPAICPCPPHCYCRRVGSAPSCKVRT